MLLTAVLSATAVPAAETRGDRVIVGRIEMITVEPGGRTLKGRIDTGAGLSSVHAIDLRIDPPAAGRPEQARFRLEGQPAREPSITADVVQWVEIKGKGTSRTVRRPVVVLALCIGERWIRTRVNLADRDRFLYPLLIGRNTLMEGAFLVDPAAKYLAPPRCSGPPAKPSASR